MSFRFFYFLFLFFSSVSFLTAQEETNATTGISEAECADEIASLQKELDLLKAQRAMLLDSSPKTVEAKNEGRNIFIVHEGTNKENDMRFITAKISLSRQRVEIFEDDELLYTWKVSTAKRGYATPIGRFTPYLLERMHLSKLYENAPMPHSVFFDGNFAIHGTDAIGRLGRRASHGCIRLHPKNAKTFYALILKNGKENTLIEIDD